MSRPRMKARPVPPAAPLAVEELRELWGQVFPTYPAPEQLDALNWHVNAYAAQLPDLEKERRDAAARAAIKTLLAWCQHDPHDNGLPHVVLQDRRLEKLEAALLEAEPLAEAMPVRAWQNPMWSIWRSVAFNLKGMSLEAGTSPGAHAVRFTGLVLRRLGHRAVTDDAISKELRTRKEFRERLTS